MVDRYHLKEESISFTGSDSAVTQQFSVELPKVLALISTEMHWNQAHSIQNTTVRKTTLAYAYAFSSVHFHLRDVQK